jgi:predicted DNA-binding transcriptional regulator AlpA
MNEKLLTIRELAEALNVPVSWCYSRSRQRGPNAMPRLNCGKYVRVRLSEVLAWLQEKQEGQEEGELRKL